MSAPFPTVDVPASRGVSPSSQGRGDPLGQSAFQQQRVVVIEEREAHIPTFYVRHENPEQIVVTKGGLPLRPDGAHKDFVCFTVADVPPERRWAIDANGEVLRQDLFADKHRQMDEEWFTVVNGRKFSGSVHREYVPVAERYVAVTVNPMDTRKLIPIGYEPHRTEGSVAKTLHDSHGDPINAEQRLDALMKAYRDPKARAKLRPHEIAEVESHLSASGNGQAAKLEELTAMLAAGEINESTYVKRVSALVGASPLVGEKKPAAKGAAKTRQRIEMACGSSIWPSQKAKHLAKCERCEDVGGDNAA